MRNRQDDRRRAGRRPRGVADLQHLPGGLSLYRQMAAPPAWSFSRPWPYPSRRSGDPNRRGLPSRATILGSHPTPFVGAFTGPFPPSGSRLPPGNLQLHPSQTCGATHSSLGPSFDSPFSPFSPFVRARPRLTYQASSGVSSYLVEKHRGLFGTPSRTHAPKLPVPVFGEAPARSWSTPPGSYPERHPGHGRTSTRGMAWDTSVK